MMKIPFTTLALYISALINYFYIFHAESKTNDALQLTFSENGLQFDFSQATALNHYEKCSQQYSSQHVKYDDMKDKFDIPNYKGPLADAGKNDTEDYKWQLWPAGHIPLKLENGMTTEQKGQLDCATMFFHAYTCIRFISYNQSSTNYLYITTDDPRKGCFSEYVGMHNGPQIVNLESPKCWNHGTIIHELMHAIGFFHEQSRDDRDDHVVIHWDNIPDQHEYQFKTTTELGINTTLVGSYDYGSIMHYARYIWAENIPTMTAKKPFETLYKFNNMMGNQEEPSDSDIEKINLLYCSDHSGKFRSLCTSDHIWNYLEPNRLQIHQEAIVDCVVSNWRVTNACNVACGGGVETLVRKVIKVNDENATDCPPLNKTRTCNNHPCPIDCQLEWVEDGPCSEPCGKGEQRYNLKIISEAQHGGKKCSQYDQTRQFKCNLRNCSKVCITEYVVDGPCSVTCGNGTKDRLYKIVQEAGPGEKPCNQSDLNVKLPCMMPACNDTKIVYDPSRVENYTHICDGAEIIETDETFLETNKAPEAPEEQRCDAKNDLFDGRTWFKLSGKGGIYVLNRPVIVTERCGTSLPGWVDGRYPRQLHEHVRRPLCYYVGVDHFGVDTCQQRTTLDIVKCGQKDFAFRLTALPLCNLAFCSAHTIEDFEEIDWIENRISRKLYVFFYIPVTFWNAVKSCAKYNGTLASISSATENEFVDRLVPNNTITFYLGGHKINDSYVWLDESEWSFENWNNNPSNSEASESSCIASDKLNSSWLETNCQQKLSYVCQRKLLLSDQSVKDTEAHSQDTEAGIMVIGGFDGDSATSTIGLFNPHLHISQTLNTKLRTERYGHSGSQWTNGTILITGGISRNEDEVFVSSEIIDIHNNSISAAAPLLVGRYYAASTYLQGNVFTCGGFIEAHWGGGFIEATDSCQVFDGNSWQSVHKMNEGRAQHAMVEMKRYLFVMGGCLCQGSNWINTMERYNGYGWDYVGTMNSKRSLFAAAVLDDQYIIACGGQGRDGGHKTTLSICERYSFWSNSWQQTASLKNARFEFAMTEFDGSLYVMGGENDIEVLESIELYDAVKDEWKLLPDKLDMHRSAFVALQSMNDIRYHGGEPFSPVCVDAQFKCAHYGTIECVGESNYLGDQSYTQSKISCQTWSENNPHSHQFASVGPHNKCRNPDRKRAPWCYTTDENIEWEYCFPDCNEGILLIGGWIWHPSDNEAGKSLSSIELFNPLTTQSKLVRKQLKQQRYGLVCSFWHNGTILVTGGDNEGLMSETEIIDMRNKSSTYTAQLLDKRNYAAAAYKNGKVYVCGGFTVGQRVLNTCELFDGDEWILNSQMAEHRAAAAMVELNGYLFIMGGTDGSEKSRTVERYDGDKWKYMANMVNARSHFDAAVLENYIYVCGGYDDNSDSLQSCERHSFSLDIWHQVESLHEARHEFGLVAFKGNIYALGGENAGRSLMSVEAYNPSWNKWTKLGNLLNTPRTAFAAISKGDHSSISQLKGIFVIGGWKWNGKSFGPRLGQPLASIEFCDVSRESCNIRHLNLQTERLGHKSVLMQHGGVMVIGGFAHPNVLSSTEILHLQHGLVTDGPPLLHARFYHGTAKIENEIYVCGGGGEIKKRLKSCEVLKNNNWNRIADMQKERKGPAMVSMDKFVYVIGGMGDDDAGLYSVERYNGDTWNYVNPMHTRRTFLEAAIFDKKIIACGGKFFDYSQSKWEFTDICERYDPALDSWQILTRMIVARAVFSLIPTDENLYALGGEGRGINGSVSLDSIEKFNPLLNKWQMAGHMFIAREASSAAAIGFVEKNTNSKETNSCVDTQRQCAYYGEPQCEAVDAYSGEQTITQSMMPCKKWSLQEASDLTLHESGNHNRCRNPDGKLAPWCNVLDEEKEWEYCFPDCNEGVLLLAGADNDYTHNTVVFYNPITQEEKLYDLELSDARRHHMAALLPKRMVLVTGGISNNEIVASTEIIFMHNQTIIPSAQMADKRYKAGIVTVYGRIFVCGGVLKYNNYTTTTKKCEMFENGTWHRTPELKQDRCAHGMVAMHNHIYVIGGYGENQHLSSVERYDLDSKTWSYMSRMIIKRSDFNPAVLDDYIYVCGGWNGELLSSCERYHYLADNWHFIASLNMPRDYFSMVNFKGNVYAIAGYDGNAMQSVERYDILKNEWVITGNLTLSRYAYSAIILDYGIDAENKPVPNISYPTCISTEDLNQVCTNYGEPECMDEKSYVGEKSVTRSMAKCQYWPSIHADYQKKMNHSKCRNPNAALAPWCYSDRKTMQWDYCFNDCNEGILMAVQQHWDRDSDPAAPVIAVYNPSTKRSYLTKYQTKSAFTGQAYAKLNDGQILIVGGGSGEITGYTEILNLTHKFASFSSPMKARRALAAVAVLNQTVYICGGYFNRTSLKSCEQFLGHKWIKIEDMHDERIGHKMVTIDPYIFSIGGRKINEKSKHQTVSSFLNTVERFNGYNWIQVSPMNNKRSFFGAASFNGIIYVCGGGFYDDDHAYHRMNSCERYDHVNDSWENIAGLNEARSDFMLATFDGTLYAIGGVSSALNGTDVDDFKVLKSIEVYDVDTDTWHMYDDLQITNEIAKPVAIEAFIQSKVNSTSIYIFGGWKWDGTSFDQRLGRVLASIEFCDYSTESCHIHHLHLKTERFRHKSILMQNSEIMVIGGFNRLKALSSTEIINFQYGVVTHGPPLLGARYDLGAARWRNEIYVCGGQGEIDTLKSCEFFKNNMWIRITDMQQERRGPAMVSMDKFLYVIGGMGEGDGGLKSVERYDGDKWNYVAPMHIGRMYLEAAIIDKKIIACGGNFFHFENLKWELTDICERYNPALDSWQILTRLIVARADFSLIATDENLYALGGEGRGINGSVSLDSIEKFNPLLNKWQMAGHMFIAREGSSAAAIGYVEKTTNSKETNSCVDTQRQCAYYGEPQCEAVDAYNGEQTITQSMMPCQKWSLQGASDLALHESGNHNWCRNPDGKLAPWCNVLDEEKEWEYCFPDCNEGVLLLAGADNDYTHNTVVFYNPITQEEKLYDLELSDARRHHMAALLPKRMVLVTGGISNNEIVASTEIIFMHNQTIIPSAQMADKRYKAGIVTVSGGTYACGGVLKYNNYTTTTKKCEMFENGTWYRMPDMKHDRCAHGMVAMHNHIYVIGGYGENQHLNSVERYDLESKAWSYMSRMIIKRSDFNPAVLDDYIYVCGGWNGETISLCERYHYLANNWHSIASLNMPRSLFSVVNFKNKLYAIAGYDGNAMQSVERYDILKNEWVITGNLTLSRYAYSAIILDYGIDAENKPVPNISYPTCISTEDLNQVCTNYGEPECMDEKSYVGEKSVTRSMAKCQYWPSIHADYQKKMNHSKCRNPNAALAPWCYTDRKTMQWDYCFNDCNEGILMAVQQHWARDSDPAAPVIAVYNPSTKRSYLTKYQPKSAFTGQAYAKLNDGQILIVGGGSDEITGCTEILNLTHKFASFSSPMKARRAQAAVAVLNQTVYVCGGYFNRTSLKSCEQFLGHKWITIEDMHDERIGHKMVTIDPYIFSIGGRKINEKSKHQTVSSFLNTVERFNGYNWIQVSPMNNKRSFFGAASFNGIIYVCGGGFYDDDHAYHRMNSCERYDHVNDSWENIAGLNEARSDFMLATFDGKLYAIGGVSSALNGTDVDDFKVLKSIEVYDVDTDTWHMYDDLQITNEIVKPVAIEAFIQSKVKSRIEIICETNNVVQTDETFLESYVTPKIDDEHAFGTRRCDFRTNYTDGIEWFRLSGTGGNAMLSTQVTDSRRCGTSKPGWIDGEHPSEMFQLVTKNLCYKTETDVCYQKVEVDIIKCDKYDFVYRMEAKSYCNLAFCTRQLDHSEQ